MKTETYNGWTNYETWNVKLWIDNDEGSSRYWQEQADAAYANSEAGTLTREEEAVCLLSSNLEEYFREEMHDLLDQGTMSASMWADLLGSALSSVNWREIAESMIGDVDKDEEETAEGE